MVLSWKIINNVVPNRNKVNLMDNDSLSIKLTLFLLGRIGYLLNVLSLGPTKIFRNLFYP